MAAETNQIIETENSARTYIAVKTPLAFGICPELEAIEQSFQVHAEKDGCSTKATPL